MYGANEKILNHIENFDALSTSAGEQTFKNFGQSAGEKTFEDSSKPGIKDGITEWIKANMAASIAILGAAALIVTLSIIITILGKKKLNRLETGVLDFDKNTELRLAGLLYEKVITEKEKANIEKYAKYVQLNYCAQWFDDVEKALKTCIKNASKTGDENTEKRTEAADALSFALAKLQNKVADVDKASLVSQRLNDLVTQAGNLFELKNKLSLVLICNIDFTKPNTTHVTPTADNATSNAGPTLTLSSAFDQFKAIFGDIKNTFNKEVAAAKAERPGVFSRVFMHDFTKRGDEIKRVRSEVEASTKVDPTKGGYDTESKEFIFGDQVTNQIKKIWM